jgi:hypothetical protein
LSFWAFDLLSLLMLTFVDSLNCWLINLSNIWELWIENWELRIGNCEHDHSQLLNVNHPLSRSHSLVFHHKCCSIDLTQDSSISEFQNFRISKSQNYKISESHLIIFIINHSEYEQHFQFISEEKQLKYWDDETNIFWNWKNCWSGELIIEMNVTLRSAESRLFLSHFSIIIFDDGHWGLDTGD